jgi:hypothetical protein
MRFVPGCCACEPPCCFNVKVQECGVALPGVTITLKLSGTTILTGVSNGVGLVASGGTVQTHCTGSAETYALTWDYVAVNKDRIQPASTSYSFDPTAGCPTGTTTITINFAGI